MIYTREEMAEACRRMAGMIYGPPLDCESSTVAMARDLCDKLESAAAYILVCRCQESEVQPPRLTILEALDAIRVAGGSGWDDVADPEAIIQEYRGEVQPPD